MFEGFNDQAAAEANLFYENSLNNSLEQLSIDACISKTNAKPSKQKIKKSKKKVIAIQVQNPVVIQNKEFSKDGKYLIR